MKSPYLSCVKLFSLLSVSLFFFINSCTEKHSEKSSNNLKETDIKGDVRTLAETVFRIDSGPDEIQNGAIISKSIHYFNREGNAIEDKYLSSDGTQRGRTTYKYDENDNLILKIDLDHSGDLEYSEDYKYDQEGREIERNGIRPPNSHWNVVIYYDKTGNLKKGSYHALVKSQSTKIIFRYDEKGNKVEEKILESEKHLISRRVNIFDENGYLKGSDLYDSKDTLIQRTIFKYDGSGNIIEQKQGNSKTGFETIRSWEYDEKGNMIRETLAYEENKTIYTFNYYSYDKQGNWHIKAESFSSPNTGEVNTIITERVIGYY
jgi:hypothetical protein